MDKNLPEDFKEKLKENFESTILYSKEVGNIYTGSLYLGLLSLLENSKNLVAGDQIASLAMVVVLSQKSSQQLWLMVLKTCYKLTV